MRRPFALASTRWAALLCAALSATPAAPARSAPLSAVEARAVKAVDERNPAALALLERAVNVNSGTMNFDGVREVGRIFTGPLDSLGFRTRWIDGSAWGRAGHLVAERSGRAGARRVLLIGHLDTVFERDSPFQRFERVSESRARGPGVIDMKGGNVVMWLALAALRSAGALDALDVTVVLTGDEEKMGQPAELARRALIEAADAADIAIGFEDGAGDPRTAVVARRSASTWTLRTWGRPAHSSQIFREDIGSGAVFEAARILTAFHDSLAGETHLTFNPGLVLGGTSLATTEGDSRGSAFGKTNVIAESTFVAGDLRALTVEQRERAKMAMGRIAARHGPQSGAEITFADGYPPLAPSAGNRKLLAMFDRASRDLGFVGVEGVDPARAGAADIAFTAGRVDMAMDGVGLMGSGGHTTGETADLETLPMQAKRMAVLLIRLAAPSP
jgi:glutamate carboxypeptidase